MFVFCIPFAHFCGSAVFTWLTPVFIILRTNNRDYFLDFLSSFGFILERVIGKYNVTLPIVCLPRGISITAAPGLLFLLCRCVCCSAVVCFHSHRPIESGWLYCHSLASGKPTWCDITKHCGPRPQLCFRSPEQPSARQRHHCSGLLSYYCRTQMNEKQLRGGVGGRGLWADEEKWQMDEWSGVKRDRMTAGIGCQSVTGRERRACHGAVISTGLSSRAADG